MKKLLFHSGKLDSLQNPYNILEKNHEIFKKDYKKSVKIIIKF